MVKKIIITFFILLISYTLILIFNPSISASQNQNQDNIIKGQNYLYNNNSKAIKYVIVGTSLSCHINTNQIPNTYNLAFNGSSIYDGLNILVHKESVPNYVFIETNFLVKDMSNELKEQLFNFYPFYSAKYLSSLRQDKQPVTYMISKLTIIGNKIVIKHNEFMKKVAYKLKNNSTKTKEKTNTNENIFNKMLNLQKKEFDQLNDKTILHKKLNELAHYIEILTKKGTKIILFEMPINKKLTFSKSAIEIRRNIENKLNATSEIINYVHLNYKTSDGLHLTENESNEFTEIFKKEILKHK